MRMFNLIVAVMLVLAFGTVNRAAAEEYYVVKSRSGVVRVVDHKPAGRATIVKGPFQTRDEAEKALKPSTETKSPDRKP
jgi:hypothetical protein